MIVRAARFPAVEADRPNNLAQMKAHFAKLGHLGHFASVSMASVDDPFDPLAVTNGNFMPLYRGHGMHVRYEGLQKV